MASRDSLREARSWIQRAFNDRAAASPETSLELLRQGLAEAQQHGNERAIARLAKNIGLICVHLGDWQSAVSSYLEALVYTPDDGYLVFALGDAHRRLGQEQKAAEYFSLCRELAIEGGDQELLELLRTMEGQSR